MTLEELKNFNPNTHEMYWKLFPSSVPKKVTVEYLYGDFFYSGHIKFVGNNLGEYDFIQIFNNKTSKTTKCESKNFYNCFEIKPKQKESKMKIEITETKPKKTYPYFAKRRNENLIGIFSSPEYFIVLENCNSSFSAVPLDIIKGFDERQFEPLENMSVTISSEDI